MQNLNLNTYRERHNIIVKGYIIYICVIVGSKSNVFMFLFDILTYKTNHFSFPMTPLLFI